MSNKEFSTFAKLLDYRRQCPICSKNLIYKISTNVCASKIPPLEIMFERLLNPEDITTFFTEFSPADNSIIELKELNISIDIKQNTLIGQFNAPLFMLDLSIYCPHDPIGNGYEASGYIDIDSKEYVRQGNQFIFNLTDLTINWELYKICDAKLDVPVPHGNLIRILNNFRGKATTSFSIAEINLDGTNGSYIEKRIDFVGDDYFQFDNPSRVYSRISSLLILAEK